MLVISGRRAVGVTAWCPLVHVFMPEHASSESKDNLTTGEVAQLTGLSVHTMSYWRQNNQRPKTIKADTVTLYRRADVEQWLAEVDGRSNAFGGRKNAPV